MPFLPWFDDLRPCLMPAARRGEIWIIDLGMVAKPRPVLILSVEPLDHERALVTYAPRTTSLRGTRFEGRIRGAGLSPAASMRKAWGSVPTVKLIRPWRDR